MNRTAYNGLPICNTWSCGNFIIIFSLKNNSKRWFMCQYFTILFFLECVWKYLHINYCISFKFFHLIREISSYSGKKSGWVTNIYLSNLSGIYVKKERCYSIFWLFTVCHRSVIKHYEFVSMSTNKTIFIENIYFAKPIVIYINKPSLGKNLFFLSWYNYHFWTVLYKIKSFSKSGFSLENFHHFKYCQIWKVNWIFKEYFQLLNCQSTSRCLINIVKKSHISIASFKSSR